MKPEVYLDSSIAFYGAGNIGYRWAVKVTNAIAGRFVKAETDSFFFLDLLDQHAFQKDFQGMRTHFYFFRKIIPQSQTVTVEDFEKSFELFKEFPEASPRLLLRGSIMDRIGIRKIATTFSSGMEKFTFFDRTNLMSELKDMNLSQEVLKT